MLGNDTDANSDPLTAVLVANVGHGALALAANGGFTYTPTSGYNGPDSFTYKANDGTADSNTVTVGLTVTSVVNGAPGAPTAPLPANASTGASTSPTLSVHVSDPDSDPLTVTFFGRPLASGNYTQIAQNTNVTSNTDSTTNAWANLGGGQTFQWYATVKDATHTAVIGPTWTFHTTASADPVFVGAGDIADCGSPTTRTPRDRAAVVAGVDGNVWTAGDNVYQERHRLRVRQLLRRRSGAASSRSRTRPVPGNHDWNSPATSTATTATSAPNATDAGGKSYYSYDIPSSNWHIVNLDSECAEGDGRLRRRLGARTLAQGRPGRQQHART